MSSMNDIGPMSSQRISAIVKDGYTLVMPTYNRVEDLRRNLLFQDAQGLTARVLVLDSSRPDIKERNKRTINSVGLDIEHLTYDPATHPFDKFADGINRVRTPYASLCADDDLLLMGGLRASLAALAREPAAAVAHGYYFLFGHLQDTTNIDITTMLYASPSIDDDEPHLRLRTLMRSYQALTYGVFRTPVIQELYRSMGNLQSLMLRELISGAIPVLRGKSLRVPELYMARAHATGDDSGRKRWHPLEWFMRDAPGLMAEYAEYRRLLINALADSKPARPAEQHGRLIDAIHAGYLFKHMPPRVQDYVIKEELAGRGIDDYWSDQPLQQALVEEHNSEFKPPEKDAFVLTRRVADYFPAGVIDSATGSVGFWPVVTRSQVRDYRFYGSFLDNSLSSILDIDGPAIRELVNTLDLYVTD
ncbi:MAG TPA: TIGR00180 family glycosyltransferase [Hyphomicrobiaceae bacterium]|nr:TIGR00180 family glycosyltransferase [Hyphomicrobiaceae bacterium]